MGYPLVREFRHQVHAQPYNILDFHAKLLDLRSRMVGEKISKVLPSHEGQIVSSHLWCSIDLASDVVRGQLGVAPYLSILLGEVEFAPIDQKDPRIHLERRCFLMSSRTVMIAVLVGTSSFIVQDFS